MSRLYHEISRLIIIMSGSLCTECVTPGDSSLPSLEGNAIPLRGERNENRLRRRIRDQTGRENCLTRSLINYLARRPLYHAYQV